MNQNRFLLLTADNLRDGILAASSKTSSTGIQDQEQEMINRQLILKENEMVEKSLHKLAGRPENSDSSLLGSVPEPPAPSDPVAAETAAAEADTAVASSAAVSAISAIERAKRQSLLNNLAKQKGKGLTPLVHCRSFNTSQVPRGRKNPAVGKEDKVMAVLAKLDANPEYKLQANEKSLLLDAYRLLTASTELTLKIESVVQAEPTVPFVRGNLVLEPKQCSFAERERLYNV